MSAQDDVLKVAYGIVAVRMAAALVLAPDLRLRTLMNTFNNVLEEVREKDESHIIRGYD